MINMCRKHKKVMRRILNSIDYLLNNPLADQWVCNDDQDSESSELSDDIAKNVYN